MQFHTLRGPGALYQGRWYRVLRFWSTGATESLNGVL